VNTTAEDMHDLLFGRKRLRYTGGVYSHGMANATIEARLHVIKATAGTCKLIFWGPLLA